MDCTRCGACCVAPDIAALDKPVGLRCPNLTDEQLCGIYPDRPRICRDYQADDFCLQISAPTLEERVQRYLVAFGLEGEARRVRELGLRSMVQARQAAKGDLE